MKNNYYEVFFKIYGSSIQNEVDFNQTMTDNTDIIISNLSNLIDHSNVPNKTDKPIILSLSTYTHLILLADIENLLIAKFRKKFLFVNICNSPSDIREIHLALTDITN